MGDSILCFTAGGSLQNPTPTLIVVAGVVDVPADMDPDQGNFNFLFIGLYSDTIVFEKGIGCGAHF